MEQKQTSEAKQPFPVDYLPEYFELLQKYFDHIGSIYSLEDEEKVSEALKELLSKEEIRKIRHFILEHVARKGNFMEAIEILEGLYTLEFNIEAKKNEFINSNGDVVEKGTEVLNPFEKQHFFIVISHDRSSLRIIYDLFILGMGVKTNSAKMADAIEEYFFEMQDKEWGGRIFWDRLENEFSPVEIRRPEQTIIPQKKTRRQKKKVEELWIDESKLKKDFEEVDLLRDKLEKLKTVTVEQQILKLNLSFNETRAYIAVMKLFAKQGCPDILVIEDKSEYYDSYGVKRKKKTNGEPEYFKLAMKEADESLFSLASKGIEIPYTEIIEKSENGSIRELKTIYCPLITLETEYGTIYPQYYRRRRGALNYALGELKEWKIAIIPDITGYEINCFESFPSDVFNKLVDTHKKTGIRSTPREIWFLFWLHSVKEEEIKINYIRLAMNPTLRFMNYLNAGKLGELRVLVTKLYKTTKDLGYLKDYEIDVPCQSGKKGREGTIDILQKNPASFNRD